MNATSAATQEPDESMRLTGSTGTDVHQHYVDDGLQQRYEGLQKSQLEIAKNLTELAALFGPARAEARYMKLCRQPRYKVGTFKTINRCAWHSHFLGSLPLDSVGLPWHAFWQLSIALDGVQSYPMYLPQGTFRLLFFECRRFSV